VSRPTIRHGTRNCYLHGCRRFECALAQSRYRAEWNARRQRGPVMVSSHEVRRHIRFLHDQRGMGVTQIAKVAGRHGKPVEVATVHKIFHGRQQRIHATTAAQILAVTPMDDRLVDAAPTWRRVRELEAVGVRQYEIAKVVRGYRRRVAPDEKPGTIWPGPQHRGLNLSRKPGGRIHSWNEQAVERFYVDYFHRIVRRATPEEQRNIGEEYRQPEREARRRRRLTRQDRIAEAAA
jgi:hypothetical protein